MAHHKLSATDDWKLVHSEQDIRGWEVRDGNDRKLGIVDDMIVNTDTEYVDLIRLEDGTEYPAKDILIGDRIVYIENVEIEGVESVVKVYDDYGRIVRTEYVDEEVYAGYGDNFREHYTTTYGTTGGTYEDYEPGYRFGYEMACAPRYQGKSYDEIDAEARTLYTEKYADRDYNRDAEAARYAFEHHRQTNHI